jgi:hypothetical protein
MNEFDEQGRKHGVWRKTSAHIAGEDYVDGILEGEYHFINNAGFI